MSQRRMLGIVGAALVVLAVAAGFALNRGRARNVADHRPEGSLDQNGRPIVKKPPPPSAAVLAFLGPITDGAKVGPGKVVRVSDLTAGRLRLTLATAEGVKFDVDLLKTEPGATGVANAKTLGVFLANAGNGSAKTDEAQGQVIMALANEIATREQTGAKLEGLETLTQQRARQQDAPDGGTTPDGGR